MKWLQNVKYFNGHYLGYIWIIGIVFLAIILLGKFVERQKFNKLVKQKELEKQQLINSKKVQKSL